MLTFKLDLGFVRAVCLGSRQTNFSRSETSNDSEVRSPKAIVGSDSEMLQKDCSPIDCPQSIETKTVS